MSSRRGCWRWQRTSMPPWLAVGTSSERQRLNAGELSELSTPLIHVDDAGQMQVYVYGAGIDTALVAALASQGLQAETSNTEMAVVQGWVAHNSLNALAAVPGVRSIAPPGLSNDTDRLGEHHGRWHPARAVESATVSLLTESTGQASRSG